MEGQCPWREPNLRAKSPCLPVPPPPLGSSYSPEFLSQGFAFPCCEFMCPCALTSAVHSLLSDQNVDLSLWGPGNHPKASDSCLS